MSTTSDAEDGKAKKGKNYLATAIGSVIVLLVVQNFWPDVIPFKTFEFWHVEGGLADWLGAAWPFLLWGVGVNAVIRFTTLNDRLINKNAEAIILVGALISLWAGVVEEICFRWLIFLNYIVTAKVGNFLFFGFLGFGVPEWLQTHLTGPIADFLTLGHLHGWIFHPTTWAVGAGVLAANAFFRDGHKYQGWFGTMNSWFMGMFFFYMMFTYGLPVAILAHFTYDFLIFIVAYVDAAIERAQGRV